MIVIVILYTFFVQEWQLNCFGWSTTKRKKLQKEVDCIYYFIDFKANQE